MKFSNGSRRPAATERLLHDLHSVQVPETKYARKDRLNCMG